LDLFEKVRRAVDGCDLDELTYDPWPEEWGIHLLAAPLPEGEIWLPHEGNDCGVKP